MPSRHAQSRPLTHDDTGSQDHPASSPNNVRRRFEPMTVDNGVEVSDAVKESASKTSRGLYIVHIFLVVVYLFNPPQMDDSSWLVIIRRFIIGLFLVVTSILLFLHFAYALRNKLQIFRAFAAGFISSITVNIITGGILTNTVGLAMISVTFAITFPELKGNILAILGGDGPAGGILPF
ncbi:hypothetical protein V8F06_009487 [Rhypophila decipiens]